MKDSKGEQKNAKYKSVKQHGGPGSQRYWNFTRKPK